MPLSVNSYALIRGATAVQTAANVQKMDGSVAGAGKNPIAQVTAAANPSQSVANVSIQGVVSSATPGTTVSASFQPVASFDGLNWVAQGSAVAISASTNSATNAASFSNTAFPYWGAYCTAISGTGATLNVDLTA